MRELFNEEQLIVLKEIAQDQDLVDKVKWWIKKEKGEKFCPMSSSTYMSLTKECRKLCNRIWPIIDPLYRCPCNLGLPVKEAALIIIDEASK